MRYSAPLMSESGQQRTSPLARLCPLCAKSGQTDPLPYQSIREVVSLISALRAESAFHRPSGRQPRGYISRSFAFSIAVSGKNASVGNGQWHPARLHIKLPASSL